MRERVRARASVRECVWVCVLVGAGRLTFAEGRLFGRGWERARSRPEPSPPRSLRPERQPPKSSTVATPLGLQTTSPQPTPPQEFEPDNAAAYAPGDEVVLRIAAKNPGPQARVRACLRVCVWGGGTPGWLGWEGW